MFEARLAGRPLLQRAMRCRLSLAGAASIGAMLALGLPHTALAQTTPAQPAPPEAKAPAKTKVAKAAPAKTGEATPEQKAAAETAKAEKAFEAALKLAQAGKHEPAVQGFTAALAGGRLSKATMAKALYQRGAAQRKLGRPAQAIADLTSASWLKDALTDAERTDALAQRSAAYKEAGLAEPGGDAGKAGATAGATPPVNWSTTAAGRAGAAAAPEAPAASPASGGAGGFFTGLFGGSAAATEPAPTPGKASAAPAATAPTSAVSSWTQATEVAGRRKETAKAEPAKTIQTAAIAAAPPVAIAAPAPVAAKPSASGKYRLQVAAVRTTEEARAIATRLQAEHTVAIGARIPEIDQTVHGNMGTFYRVNLGPYGDAKESQALCGRIRATGLDCMVITR